MLLGNGFLLNKLPTNFIGGLVSNNTFTNPSMMLKTYTSFKMYDSIPAGYGGQSIVLPIKAGAMSIIDKVTVAQYMSMANLSDSVAIALDTEMGAYAKASAADVVVVALDGSLTAYANASMGDTVVVDISAFIGAVMGASANDTIQVTMSGTIGALLGASVHDTVTLTMSGNIGGYYGGVMHDTVTISGNTPIIFGSALAGAHDTVNIVMTSAAKGDGWMRADATSESTTLTAREIWEYYARTLTSGGGTGGGATAQEIWEYGNRELTSALPSGLDETQLHAALDSYTHKDSYKADVSNVSANVVKVNGVAVSSINDFKTAEVTVDLSTIPQDVWTYGSRALTAAAGLTTEQAAKLNSLSNYTSIHADLDSYANKFAWKTDVSELINGVNIKQVAGTAVNSINDFKSAPVSLTALTAQIDGVQASVDTVDNKLDVLNTGAFTTADRNKLASLTNYDTLHEDLDTYGNKGLWKADVSSLASGVNVTKIAGVQVNGVDDFKSEAADLTPVLTAIAGLNDVTASEVRAAFNANDFKGENTETQIHNWLDSYGGKAQWKTDVSSLISGVNIKAVNGTVITGINDFKAPATDLTPVITAINDVRVYTPSEIRAEFNPADFTSKNTQLEIHTWLDSYGNKSAWKADVNSLLAGVNVSKVAGVAVNGIADFRAPAVDLSGISAKVDSVKNVLDSVDDKADVLVAKDGFTSGDRNKLNALTNYSSLHADLDGYANKALWKADLTPVIAGVNVVKVAGSNVASVEDFKAAPTDLSGVQSAIAELKVDSTVIKSKTAELTNYNDTVVKGKLDVLIAKDTFGPADRELATEVNGKIADLIADVEDSKVEVKAHVTSSVAPLATATNVAAIKMELDDVKASIDAILADMVALDSGSTASLYAKIAQLKADVANVQTTASELPDQVWSKVV